MQKIKYSGDWYEVLNGKLDLNDMNIQDIDEIIGLWEQNELKILYLSNNQIREIGGFDALYELEILDLSENKIEIISNLNNLQNLNVLNIGNNKITNITGLENLLNLRQLNLFENQIKEIQGLDTLKHLLYLNLNDNRITKIKGLNNLIKLEKLDLSYNHITEINGLENLKNLRELNLSHNRITNIKGLDNLTNLKVLYLGSNPIKRDLLNELDNVDFDEVEYPQRIVEYCKYHKENNEKINKKEISNSIITRNVRSTKLEDFLLKLENLYDIKPKEIPSKDVLNIGEENYVHTFSSPQPTILYSITKNQIESLFLYGIKQENLIEQIWTLPILKSLYINNCNFKIFPNFISNISHLETLSIKKINNIEYPVDFLQSMRNIKNLSLNNLTFIDNLAKTRFIESIWSLTNLEILKIENFEVLKISNDIDKLTKLKKLIIENILIEDLPNSLKHLQKLEKLFISSNNFHEFPSIILELKNLKSFYMHNNHFNLDMDSDLLDLILDFEKLNCRLHLDIYLKNKLLKRSMDLN